MTPDPYADFEKVQLDSGVTVFISPQKYSCKVCIGMSVMVGGRDGLPGITHYLEHCLSAATSDFVSHEAISQFLNQHGIIFDFGNTTLNSMIFTGKAPIGKEPELINVFSQLLAYPTFPLTELDTERGVILSEIVENVHVVDLTKQLEEFKLAAYDPVDREYVRKRTSSFKILGTPEDIKVITRNDLIQHYHQFVVPTNLVVFVTGNVEKKKIIDLLGQTPLASRQGNNRPSKLPLLKNVIYPSQQQTRVSLQQMFKNAELKADYSTVALAAIYPGGYSEQLGIFACILREEIFRRVRTKRGETYSPGYKKHDYDDHSIVGLSVRTTGSVEVLLDDIRAAMDSAANDRVLFEKERQDFIRQMEIYDEDSFAIMEAALYEYSEIRQILTLVQTQARYRAIRFEDYQRFAADLIKAIHFTIILP